MSSLEYEDVFRYFLGEVTDPNFAAMSTTDAYELMREYLHKTIAEPYVRRIFSSISLNDEIQVLEYEVSFKEDESADADFVKLILSKGMAVKWFEPQVRSKQTIAQMFYGKEQSGYSQANHLNAITEAYNNLRLELRKMIRDRGYINNEYLNQ